MKDRIQAVWGYQSLLFSLDFLGFYKVAGFLKSLYVFSLLLLGLII